MTINSLKELKKLLVLARQEGVESMKVDNIEFHLGRKAVGVKAPDLIMDPLATASIPTPKIYNEVSENDKIEMPDELTEEQLLNWSSRPESFESKQ